MSLSLALKKLVSSSNIHPSSVRVVRSMAITPSDSRFFSTDTRNDRDERHISDDHHHVPSLSRPVFHVAGLLSQVLLSSMVIKGEAKESNEGGKKILRPLSPHLPVYQPHLNSTLSISNRISGVFLTVAVLVPYLLHLKMGSICLTNANFYQILFYSSKLLPVTGSIAAVALAYHTFYGVRHLIADIRGR